MFEEQDHNESSKVQEVILRTPSSHNDEISDTDHESLNSYASLQGKYSSFSFMYSLFPLIMSNHFISYNIMYSKDHICQILKLSLLISQ